jgi:hypothetical protein
MLTEEQKDIVRGWAQAGSELGEIHRRLGEELGIRMTYFEARLLVSELNVSLDKPEDPEDVGLEVDDALAMDTGGVSVTVDQIAQPHAMVSGRVRFSDGKGAGWYVDQTGRLGIDPDEEGYRPVQEDVVVFQKQLQETLKSQGF